MPPAFAGGFWKITAAQRHLLLTPTRDSESPQDKKFPARRYSLAELKEIDARHAMDDQGLRGTDDATSA